MPRSRNIKYSFFQNDELAECDPLGRLLFIGLWTLADREGVLEDRPKKIKAAIYPFEDVDVDSLLGQLASKSFVIRYEQNGVKCLWLPKFSKHQSPHQSEPTSDLPRYEHGTSTVRAPGAHQTHTGRAPDEHGARPVQNSGAPALIADSCLLIAERGTLNPERGLLNEELGSIPSEVCVEPATPAATDTQPTTKARRSKPFVIPTVEEVAAYCLERKNKIDPAQFVDYYEARGWIASKTPMRSWQAAVRLWESNQGKLHGGKSTADPRGNLAMVERFRREAEQQQQGRIENGNGNLF